MKWQNFILFYGWLFHYVYDFLSQSSVDRLLGSFHVLAIVSSAAINIGVHVSFQIRVFFFSRHSGGSNGKEPACQCRTHDTRLWSLGQEDPLRRGWQPTPVFLPRESHGQRNLLDHSSWGHKESDMAEWQSTHAHTRSNIYIWELHSQAYEAYTCPGSRSKKEPRVSRRHIICLMDGGAYTSEARSQSNTLPWCGQDMAVPFTLGENRETTSL